jgi:hypothetical protein
VPASTAIMPHATDLAELAPLPSRLLTHAGSDVGFKAAVGTKKLRVGGFTVRPTALDSAACTLARTLIGGRADALALSFPRGRGAHPALLGVSLSMWRQVLPSQLCGSVVVSTARGELSKQLRELTLDSSQFERFGVGRLVAENVPGTAGFDLAGNPRPPRKRPSIRPLDRSARRGISQADGFLLFARPNTLPPVPQNVVWAMVVDTIGTAGPRLVPNPDEPDSWTRTWDTNINAGRKQLWVGEVGDTNFERFCADKGIPLVAFDWGLIEQLAALDQDAGGPLTSAPLARRAAERPPVGFRVVEDEERDYLAREVYTLLGKLRRKGNDTKEPDVVRTAWKLCGLLCRLPCTKAAYELAAGGDRFAEPVEWMWNSIDNAKASAFVGNRWKSGYRRYWDPIRSALRKLIRLQEDEATCSKYEALVERVGEAQRNRERLFVVCQSNAERTAVRGVLTEFGVDNATVTVHTFGARRDYGPADKSVTLLLTPPPPWRESILGTGESGRVEVLCYRHELARLRARVDHAERSRESENITALDQLQVGKHHDSSGEAVGAGLAELDGYAVRDADAPDDEWQDEVPPADSTLWRQLLEQYGQELPEPAESEIGGELDSTPASPYDGYARLVRLTDGPPVFFRNDADVDVLLDDDDDADCLTIAVPAGELETGMSIAFLPGGHRSILDVLLDAYDARHEMEAKMFEPLWERAIEGAVAQLGVEGLADRVGRSRFAVYDWRAHRSIPREQWRFKRVVEASGDEEAIRAQTPLWKYLTATRGPHRHIGKLNKLAIAEAARDAARQPRLHELERYIGHDLEDLYDQVEQVTVLSVSDPVAVPLSHCGRFLPDDDPYIRSLP